ncbi:MAG TPA: tyrosine-type recombinase/integrase, partial [Ktedonobacterales bacterium]|nr:tyrosine-type recombinase/integrase [Ktedonobacterales bacterium]
CTTRSGGYLEDANVRTAFVRLCARAGVPRIRRYDMRHTAISLMAAAGNDLKAISEVVGHADPRLTARVYQHAYPQQRAAALAGLAGGLLAPPAAAAAGEV